MCWYTFSQTAERKLRSVLEDRHPSLAASSTLSEQIPLIHAVELDKVRSELQNNNKPSGDNGEIDTTEITLFRDGATSVAECYCFVAKFSLCRKGFLLTSQFAYKPTRTDPGRFC